MPRTSRFTLPTLPLGGLFVTLAALFLLGGSAREDVQSLAILNPVLIVSCGVALLTLRREQLQGNKGLMAAVILFFLLMLVSALSLQARIEHLSTDASYETAIRNLADVPSSANVAAMMPAAAWQSFFFLFVPLTVCLFAVQLNRNDLRGALLLTIGLGALSGLIGVLQLAGNPNGPFYFYRITNNGTAVGLFANRNHAAVFLACMFPLLAIFATSSPSSIGVGRNSRQLVAIAIAILLVPLILVTGSRSGMLSAFVGLIGGVLLYSSHLRAHRDSIANKSTKLIVAATVFLALVFATIYFSRAEAIDRTFASTNIANDRADFWAASLQMFRQYFPFGFGPGGFVPAFQFNEPVDLLSGSYLNQLHNDWLETALTLGVPGVIFMFVGVVYYLRRSFLLWIRMDGQRLTVGLGRMASVIIAILALASLSDYPLRTPAIAGFAALALVWFVQARH